MISTDQMVYRTTDEWRTFIRCRSYNVWSDVPPEHWFRDRFWNYILGVFEGINYEESNLVYEGVAYLWRNPITQEWEVVKTPEYLMLQFMKLVK